MVLQEESWMLMEINEMLWKFVCCWRKIWGLMSFVGLIRRWYLTVALYTFYRFCARWRPWFCAFLYYFRTRLRLLPLSRNGLQKRESSCFFCHLSLHILQVIIPELSFFAPDVSCGIELLSWYLSAIGGFGSLNIASGFQMGISFKWLQKRFCLPSDLLTHLRHAISWWFQ